MKGQEKTLLNIEVSVKTKKSLKDYCKLSGHKMGHIVDILIREWLDKKIKKGIV